MNKPCGKCNTNDCYQQGLIKEKQSEINRILKAYQKDKKFYRILVIVLALLVILSLAFGREGITMLADWVLRWFGK